MSKNDVPAGNTGGPVTVPALADLPEKLRVHALAKLIGRTSREVLATLADLGVEVRSAQSSVARPVAERVVSTLLPDPGSEGETAVADEAADAPAEPLVESEPAITPEAPAGPPVAETSTGDAAATAGAATGDAAATTDAAAAEAAEADGRPLTPLFAPPTPLFQPPTKPARSRRRAATPEPEDTGPATPAADTSSVEETTDDTAPADDSGDDSGDDDGGSRRRRRRGRRGRGRGRGTDGAEGSDDGDESDESDDTGSADTADSPDTAQDTDAAEDASVDSDDDADDSDDTADEAEGEAGSSRRRRRRRRRRGSGDDNADGADAKDADPPNTVTRIRQPREARSDESDGDGVQSVRGSTRLEAKRQRRRDGRDAGRRRAPILSEAEFLARRESVDRSMVVRQHGDRTEIGVLEDDILVEHFVTGGAGPAGNSLVGNIYLGRVQNVLPSMEAAFVDIGRGRNAVLYAGEVDWDAAGLNGKARRIEQALSSGDSVLVQVTKDPIGHKGARLTTQISLAGRFLVYVPSGGAAGISRKLPDTERKRLKDMLKEIVPSEAGVIIRTASEGVSQEALERDVRRLQAQWEVIKTKSEQTGPNKPKAPTLLYEEPDMLIKVVRDQFNEDFSRLIVSGDDAWDTVSNYVGHVAPELSDRLHRHVGPNDVFTEYRIDEQLLKALDRKVWLPSGGTLVIDRTEAMTVIDVNTGKFTGSGGNLEETVTRNNLEAAEEIVRQLRLRDIGGIIVIDFIDMVLEANRDLVLRRLTECLARDRTRHQVAEVTSLGLVQMTRKRVGGGLLEHFSTPCEHCRGRGVIVSTEPVAEKNDRGHAGSDGGGRRTRSGRGRRGDDGGPDGGRSDSRSGNGHERSDDGDRRDDQSRADQRRDGRRRDDRRTNGDDRSTPAPTEAAPPAPARPSDAAAKPAAAESGAVPAADAAPVAADPAAAQAVAAEAAQVPAADAPVAAGEPRDAAEATPAQATPVQAAPVGPPAAHAAPGGPDGHAAQPAEANGQATPARPRRRGRVTRTAGAPSTGSEATVITAPLPAARTETTAGTTTEAEPVVAGVQPTGVPAQPEPSTASRPRRSRRAASRPAGPPTGIDAGEGAGGDPV
ncbi:translation initiation factor IF-2 N-terminal domain-containing protein [Pseudonocardia sp. H11422]|uniref:translation initiation factor IF-2 N-terminal domain-containing protein n=1 Tax=Pseudonocardia sp. H11422 TaxID=2835866 RepID=UPI00292D1E9B|nr:translation initiation factor IF-2 N-terminal domain-containing protein [Pseudonocardia sp. H11422]